MLYQNLLTQIGQEFQHTQLHAKYVQTKNVLLSYQIKLKFSVQQTALHEIISYEVDTRIF